MANILIAEDEERISRFIQKGLRASGFTTTVVEDGVTALDYAATGEFDLLILDVGLPGMDGFKVLSVLRSMGSTMPVIMCTARDSVEDTVQGLDKGADDYLAKPFRFQELLARVKARLRNATPAVAEEELRYGTLSLDIGKRCAVLATESGAEEYVELSAREFSIATVFLENAGQVLTRDQLLTKVWGYDFDGASNVVDVYVRYLRNKLGPERFVTVRGVGYRLAEV
ncbi:MULTISPECIES: response regulator transcription factor [Kocuria]|uniref:Response regulator transcription factor n=1 Tax=Kocuria subflava TaxID=1736139 RepID=A0A846TRL8_9MICC|nr:MULTISPECIES: response regulator transcription factor [Kocuria]NKE09479.1 response regulator transcription factor [Kocuria subflava]